MRSWMTSTAGASTSPRWNPETADAVLKLRSLMPLRPGRFPSRDQTAHCNPEFHDLCERNKSKRLSYETNIEVDNEADSPLFGSRNPLSGAPGKMRRIGI